ncbi:stabilin-2 [Callorhinchus milii]|nr:stabilin-2 [Callorhinchus milii]
MKEQLSYKLTLILLMLTKCWQINSLGDQKSNRCDKRTVIHTKTPCRSCPLNTKIRCAPGYLQMTKGFGARNCRYKIPLRMYSLSVIGCRHSCSKLFTEPQCCSGYWGVDCMECPGGAGLPCSDKGICFDGMGGNGVCNCTEGFGGVGCENCAKENLYGVDCASECECVHGECNSGVTGNGMCTCYSGYTGAKCDESIPACRALKCPDKARCSEEMDTGKLVCKCLPNYHSKNGSMLCEPINPCLSNVCGLNAKCTYLGPNQKKCTCQESYHGDGQICLPIDPCQKGFGDCLTNSTVCVYDGPGKSHCECKDGYVNLLAGAGCSLFDVCETNNTCDKNAKCLTISPGQIECTCNKGYTGDGSICYGSIMQRIKDLHTQSGGRWQGRLTSAMLLFGTSYSWPLTNLGPFTLFLPTDKAFNGININTIISDKERTQYLAKLHIIAGQMSLEDLNATDVFYTLTGRSGEMISKDRDKQLSLRIYGSRKKGTILQGNLVASNGLIHIIDQVMDGVEPTIKSSKEKTLLTIISENGKFNQFQTLLQKGELTQLLESPGPFTVFIPSNRAFGSMKDEILDYLLSPEGEYKLKQLLRHHIIPSSKGQILLGDQDAGITDANAIGKNGRIYSLDAVLIPHSILPILPQRCDDVSYRIRKGSCVICAKHYFSFCPTGMASMESYSRGCFYRSFMKNLFFPSKGCARNCNETVIVRKCCKGFYGASCRPCSGGFINACSGNGQCMDGLNGNGTCICDDNFKGSSCHICSNPNKYGPNCAQTCKCIHGECDNKLTSEGACKPNSCKEGYIGKFCERHTTSCGPSVQFCHVQANCEYRKGTLSCVCKPNYEGDGSYCEEQNPCLAPNRGGCSANAVCNKQGPGRHLCQCLPGWTGDGEDCTEINNCLLENHGGCHMNANCIYGGPGQNDCECKKGFRGNGIECEEINPCLEENGGCHYMAMCTYSSPGIRSCRCQQGYVGDGNICYGNAVMELSSIPEAAEFLKWVNDAFLNQELSEAPNITLLVPSQQAIDSMNNDKREFWLQEKQLPNLVKYHVLKGVYSLSDLQNFSSDSLVTLMSGNILPLSKQNETSVIGSAKIIDSDVALTNGIMHIIDKVLIPDQLMSDDSMDLLSRLGQNAEYSQFRAFMIKYNLAAQVEAASSYTVFSLSNDVIENYCKKNNVADMSEDLMRYHIILDQKLMESDLHNGMHRETMLGISYQVGFFHKENQLFVNDVLMNFTDEETDKGVIHGLTDVLKFLINRCDTNDTTVLQGKCINCQYKPDCPQGSVPAEGNKNNCIFIRYVLGKRVMYLGCQTNCIKTVITRDCCAGYFGHQCQACPGNGMDSCLGNGICQDGINGTGVCVCEEGFAGTACETCIPGHYGIHCDQECACAHGKCKEGINGDGLCECIVGWRGVKCDIEITEDHCNNTCHTSANCISKADGTRICGCAAGFRGNGTFCEAVNACETGNGNCSLNAYCKRTVPGERVCVCQNGYTGDGLVCIEINPCIENNGDCDVNAECTQVGPNQAACNCLSGYEGDGTSCAPLNPCRMKNGGCSEFANCNHTGPNQRSCQCLSSYIGDGFTCKGTIYKELTMNAVSSHFFYQLQLNGVVELGGSGPFTVFVPTSEAIKKEAMLSEWTTKGQMAQILRYHIVACNQLLYNQLVSKKTLTTVHGEPIRFSFVQNVLYVNNDARIVTSDVLNANGVIHFIDKVLVPQRIQVIPKDVLGYKFQNLSTVAAQNGYSLFANLLQETNLLNVINDPVHKPVTLFLPKDSAMRSLPKEQQDFLYNKDNRDKLIEYLKFHIIRDAKIVAVDLPNSNSLKTLQGSDLSVTCGKRRNIVGELYLNKRSCRITQRHLEFDSGIAYGINCLLAPPSLGGRCDVLTTFDIKGDCGSCLNTPSCPSGTKAKNKKEKCTFRGSFHLKVDGCFQQCSVLIWKPKCCSSYFGKDCRACPGGPETPCNSHGTCDDQYTGTGVCTCSAGFNGTACELCPPNRWGPECTLCNCTENGACDDGNDGQGICYCNEGWTGARCETKLVVKPVCSPSCSENAVCKENNKCECKQFYEGDGRNCKVVQLCTQNNGGCSKFSSCSQSGMKVTCRCKDGYSGDGYRCDPIDRCVNEDNGACDEHANCIVTGPNKRKCVCKDNYVGDGLRCSVKKLPINRCLQDNGNCHTNADCTDLHFEDKTIGVFHLRSDKGQYKLNFTEAQMLCTATGAVMSTYNQLHIAQQAGYHMCAAGWIYDKKACYPTTYSNPSCGGGHIGIVDYGVRPNLSETWDVFCYRMKDVQCNCKNGYVGDGYACNGNLLQVLTATNMFSSFLTELLNYSNYTLNGRRFESLLTDLTSKGTLFVPVNSGFNKNVTLSGRDIEYHFSNLSTFLYHNMENGTVIPSRIGHSLLITNKDTAPPSPEFNQQVTKLVNDRSIIAWDIIASNGIIHVIDKPLQAPLEPPKPIAAHVGIGLGLFFTCAVGITLVAVVAYYYYNHKRGPFSFQYFKSDEDTSFENSPPSRFCNPMYNQYTSTESSKDPFSDGQQLATDITEQS